MNRRLFLLLLLLGVAFGRCAHTPAEARDATHEHEYPSEILIIRHAEKPAGPEDDGKSNSPDLSPRGYERAAALAKSIPKDFGKPDFLIATRRSKKSNRPVETITPLSKAIHEEIDSSLSDDQVAELAHRLLTEPKYAGKVVLIAWHHGKIPELAHALGARDAPDAWKGSVFDRVWVIKYPHGTAAFSDMPEGALPGDSN